MEDLKINGNIAFQEKDHKYYDINNPSNTYISVTTLIEKFAQPFDKDFWSGYKALEKLLPADAWKIERKSLLNTHKIPKELLNTYDIKELDFNKAQQSILDEWDKTNKESCERGTKIHADLEHSMYKMGANVSLKKFGVGGKFVCDKGRTALDLENGVYPEYLISRTSPDNMLRIAGQIDLLVKKGKEITILDWKGLPLDTPIPTENGWSTMGSLKVGDKVFDKDGNICSVLHKSEVHHNDCYELVFSKYFKLVADKDHRWLVYFKTHPNSKYKGKNLEKILTTEEIYELFQNNSKAKLKNGYNTPKIYLAKPLNIKERDLPIDPYLLGLWLGDGNSSDGRITQELNAKSWDIVKGLGYSVGNNMDYRDNKAETKTIYGLSKLLKSIGVLNNKHIPDLYLMASYSQRLSLLRGLMDADGYYDSTHKMFVMRTHYKWQYYGVCKLVSSLGARVVCNEAYVTNGFKPSMAYDIKFTTNLFNPFLSRNQNIQLKEDSRQYYSLQSVNPCKMVPTQCITVDSPSNTYLCTNHLLITHNTNKEIKLKAGFDTQKRQEIKMKYPLNTLPDVNYWHYALQLSTYAWMIQMIDPEYVIKDLILVHFDHNDNQTIYHLPYLKKEVESMLRFYKKSILKQEKLAKLKPIEY